MIRTTTGPGGLTIVTADRVDDRQVVEAAVRSAIGQRVRLNIFVTLGSTVQLAARVVPHRAGAFVARSGAADDYGNSGAAVAAAMQGFTAAFDAAGSPMVA